MPVTKCVGLWKKKEEEKDCRAALAIEPPRQPEQSGRTAAAEIPACLCVARHFDREAEQARGGEAEQGRKKRM